jgi:hypothetical protein
VLTVRATTFDPADTGTYTLSVSFAAAGERNMSAHAAVSAPLKRVPASTTTLSVPRTGGTWLEHIGVERMNARSH